MKRYFLVLLVILVVVFSSWYLSQPMTNIPKWEPTRTTIPKWDITVKPEPIPTRTRKATPEYDPVLVRVESVNVHTQPELNAPILGWVYQNNTIQPEICDSGWAYFTLTESSTGRSISGWIKGTCLTPNPCGSPGSCQ